MTVRGGASAGWLAGAGRHGAVATGIAVCVALAELSIHWMSPVELYLLTEYASNIARCDSYLWLQVICSFWRCPIWQVSRVCLFVGLAALMSLWA